jgi:hypothetical protein
MGFPVGTRNRGLRRLGLALVVVGVLAPPPALAAEHTSGYGQMPPPPKTTPPTTTPTTGTSLSREEKTSPEKKTSSKEAAPTTTSGTHAVEGAAKRPRARAATLHLDAITSALAKAPQGFRLIGAAGRGGLDTVALAGWARTPATHAERAVTRTSSSAKDPLGLKLPPEAGQAIMAALIVLAAWLLLAVLLFPDRLRQLLARFRPAGPPGARHHDRARRLGRLLARGRPDRDHSP